MLFSNLLNNFKSFYRLILKILRNIPTGVLAFEIGEMKPSRELVATAMFVNFCLSVKSTTHQIELNFNKKLTSSENGFSPCRVVGESWLRKLQPCFVPDLISALKFGLFTWESLWIDLLFEVFK